MNISKKLISYILIGFLCVSSCSITYYKSVHAFEWVEVGISTVEALKWLLGAFGIAATGSAAIDNFWGGYEDEFYEYANEENVSGPDVRAWLEKLATGTLDKGSHIWDIFKSWASSLVSSNSGSGGSYPYLGTAGSAIENVIGASVTLNSSDCYNFTFDKAIYFSYPIGSSVEYGFIFAKDCNLKITSSYGLYVYDNDKQGSFCMGYVDYDTNSGNVSTSSFNGVEQLSNSFYSYTFTSVSSVIQNNFVYNFNADISDVPNYRENILPWELSEGSGSGSLDTINDARQDQFDLINRTTGNEVEQEVAIPMPGIASGDDTISQDSYDAIMDRVEAGEISIDDAISDIQEIMQVLVYDIETDDVIPLAPDPDDPNENQKKDDVLKETKENMGFTLAGLENVFPFCIPWDIYAFLNILDAEPVAPVFNIPFPNVDDPEHPLTTQVDLSSWDDAMAIVRLAQDFLFIIGLAFLTRSLIGAGGGD